MNSQNQNQKINLAFVSSYLPRPCGIATFTFALREALSHKFKNFKSEIIAITDPAKNYKYPPEVKFIIQPNQSQSYIEAANYINESKNQIVNLQHEFGLFGVVGKDDGENIILFLKNLKKGIPVVTTFHMIYSNPTKHMKEVVQKICYYSQKIIVIIDAAYDHLIREYKIEPEKLIVIPHGAPRVERKGSAYYKKLLGLPTDHFILSTFGLIRAKKGLEYAISAMPSILKKFPKTLYLILGAPHPNRPKKYYYKLKDLVKKLKLEKNVIFLNRFLEFNELINYLQATNIFLAPYLVLEQVSSGALLYAMACGRVCIATPFTFAKDVLAEGRGVLIPPRDSEALAQAVINLMIDNEKRHAIENAAYKYARERVWRKIGKLYFNIFNEQIKKV